MIPLIFTVLLIENNLDDAPKIAELISLSGYNAIRTLALYPLDIVNTIQAHSPEVVMSHMSQSNMAIEAIQKSSKTIPLILVGSPSDTPMVETPSSLKIAYITSPFSQDILKAIVQLLV